MTDLLYDFLRKNGRLIPVTIFGNRAFVTSGKGSIDKRPPTLGLVIECFFFDFLGDLRGEEGVSSAAGTVVFDLRGGGGENGFFYETKKKEAQNHLCSKTKRPGQELLQHCLPSLMKQKKNNSVGKD